MTITFENDNAIIIYTLEKVISHARRTQQIFVAQCVWWLASIIGLEQVLINYIDNLQSRIQTTVLSEAAQDKPDTISEAPTKEQPDKQWPISPVPKDIQDHTRQDRVLKECEEYLKESRRLRDIASLKSRGTTSTGRINPTPISKKYLKKKDRKDRSITEPSRIVGIDEAEIQRRRTARECLRCA
jgi:hypothetical protein